MKFDHRIHHRRSLRLPDYDYTQAGAYFVTICTWQRECLFGEVVAEEMRLNTLGRIASEQWMRLARRFPGIDCETYVIMPNHVHGIIIITGDRHVLHANGRGAGEHSHTDDPQVPSLRPSGNRRDLHANGRGAEEISHTDDPLAPPLRPYTGPRVVPGSLGAIVRAFKASVTWRIHAMQGHSAPIWQRNYHEHILRDDADTHRISQYIQTNPQHWEQDQLHPSSPPNRFNRV